jgi:hypothetical protein
MMTPPINKIGKPVRFQRGMFFVQPLSRFAPLSIQMHKATNRNTSFTWCLAVCGLSYVPPATGRLFHFHPNAFGVSVKFGGVHTLHGGNAILRSCLFAQARKWILEYISAFGQPTHKKVGGGIFGAFVIAQTVLVFVLRGQR